MPLQPSRQELHVNVPLRNFSIAYVQDQADFIATKVFPRIPVNFRSDRYIRYVKEDWFRTQAQKRAPATESVGTGYQIDNSPTYFCDEWAIHKDVPWDDYDNADDYLSVDTDATELVTRHLLLRQEKIFIDHFMKAGVWTGFNKSGTVADYSVDVDGKGFWDSATSDPARDIDDLKRNVKRGTGYMPNTLVLGQSVYFELRNHPAVRDVFKYSEAGILDQGKLAALFGVENLVIAGAVLDKGDAQNPNLDFMCDNDVLLCYSAKSPGLKTPTAGATFDWKGRAGAGGDMSTLITTIDMPLIRAKRIEANMAFDMRLVGPDLGVYAPRVLQKAV